MKINDWPNVWFRWVYIPSNLARVLPQRLGKMEKKVFPAYFRHFWTEKFFFQKSGSVTFWALPFSTFVPKIRKKTNEPISRKAGNRRTDEHTNGERLIYRTSKVGPKNNSSIQNNLPVAYSTFKKSFNDNAPGFVFFARRMAKHTKKNCPTTDGKVLKKSGLIYHAL